MKKLLFLPFAFLFLSVALFAQKQAPPVAPVLPIDSITKLITYEGVIEVKDANAALLYKRMQEWFRSYYKNPTEVIRENDSIKMKMTGKPRMRISNPPDKTGLRTDAGLIQYTITVAAKDGRYRYELTAFNWKQPSYYACERWFDTKSQLWTPSYYDYLQQLDKTSREVISNLQEALSKDKPVKDRDNW